MRLRMEESMHERYDRDERDLVATAAEMIWSDELLDAVVDIAAPILAASEWFGVPTGAPPRWVERATAAGALTAIALRAARTTALTVRAGYAAESLAGLRRLQEAGGHAQRVAQDASGQYAENWLRGRGKADSPRIAFGAGDPEDATWALMSGQSHAEFAAFTNFSTEVDEQQKVIHLVGPSVMTQKFM